MGGGEWLNSKDPELIVQEVCPICLEKFNETPNKAIYKSDCGHIFHNDCLVKVCEGTDMEKMNCPLCRKPLEDDCNDVYAFREKVLGRQYAPEGAPYFSDPEIQNIYENQP